LGLSAFAFSAKVLRRTDNAARSSEARWLLKGKDSVVGPTWSSNGFVAGVVEVEFYFRRARKRKGEREGGKR